MRKNAKTKIRASAAPAVLATDLRFTPGGELAVGNNGELNASSKKDLIFQQRRFLQASANGNLVTAQEVNAIKEDNKAILAAMWNDENTHRIVGERLTDALYVTQNRQGFCRRFLAKNNPNTGSIIRFKVYKKDTVVSISTSPTRIETQVANDNYYTPPEAILVARIYVTQNDLNQSPGDPLGDKYIEATEAVMVTEDRWWKRLADASIGLADGNPQTIISGQLTPYTLARVRTNVTQWGLKAPHVLIASDIYEDIIGNNEFYSAFDPVARHELLLTGEIATLYGMTVTSDAYRHEQHRVLSAGEFYVIADSVNHGAYADRDSLQSAPIGIETEGIPGRGWVVTQSFAASIANARSVAKGIRV